MSHLFDRLVRRPAPLWRPGVVACATCLVLTGCSQGAVEVDVPDLDRRAATVCQDLLRRLPATVDGAARREVRPSDAPAAAWGDPAIVLRCGVPAPAGLDDFATCHEVDGVGWYVPEEKMTGEPVALTMTTIGREVRIEVSVPESHWPPANTMVDVGAAVDAAVRETDPCV